ncbi:cysteine--tRNA ligase [Candidatus Woesebacteria bacterium RIFCSPHIGHO2_01_FULL_39_32]|uniref:Cysteine--tRNA ligase n=2 Tax=Candidatus Woeseibacteriota TaxID=1752722 RepID=A0A0G0SYV2_9BACT|nr:MAG: Cysteine-tRNA ligase [Candidatus Woesebacteria bacterium GW2011_GWA1_39_8]OGM03451.1 MAG: cysteine--tRNA ligase [Candidatus Woesebacteria bacterium GWB1_37_5]OGM23948.1 MAG: cysteine--tRNA ligase [Candidatus Woesebacteria bacterium RIFCSPHIGHO2_01_FULL_39_32]OGM37454.1 MAG: cysteine--tRNA ligase [Candidatus Woesebacteria bacterium RIFCSPHIGHO2_12_FULL_38_11]OGM64137.1 MAG: cysteine--tRNA ligase [Candidatus Woesebacteria bacterium RIFCSPLOWO2_01_FULL_39_25]
MTELYLTNSLTRKKEKFEPINPPNVGMYTCGPTVYDYASIGNFRTYVTGDILVRTLKYNGYQVRYVMNFTDVGHLTGDNLGDADTGVDRLVKAAKRERKTAWDIAKFYTEAFLKDFEKLNLTKADTFAKATDHIKDQMDLIKKLEENGITYKIPDGIYFDTIEFEKSTGKKYGELSTLDQIKEGARVKVNKAKKNPRDFALWKFSDPSEKRDMEWDSPWGVGFPGWHIECSAMSMKYLGETFDIHAGGEDLRSTHHPNEIAQSEGATGKKFVKYWIHGAFLKVDGKRMGKSLGNFYTITDIEKKGYGALALRYFYLTGKYNEPLNFTWDSLKSSQQALDKLNEQVLAAKTQNTRTSLSEEKRKKVDGFSSRFLEAVNDDLNTPRALAVLWDAMKSNIPSEDKYDLALSFDEVLGLKLSEVQEIKFEIPEEVGKLISKREKLRKEGKFDEADNVRKNIEEKGFLLEDTPEGLRVKTFK